ncbi:MAG TPA: family 20 glycosylhydrolase, partial [Vicinamibacteria bacterium]
MRIAPVVLCLPASGLFAPVVRAAVDHDLIPAPARLEWGQGSLPLDRGFSVAALGTEDPRVASALRRSVARLSALTGLALREPVREAGRARLVVEALGTGQTVQKLGEDESYRLVVTSTGARLSAPNPLGILRGLATVHQLVRREGSGFVIPAVTIEDRPRFPWRGLLVDPSRRFQPVEVIRRILDGMAEGKLNVLHWHLSEDQGFRIESRVFPLLHEKGSDGLFYTQDEAREIVAYARDRGIRVVPEFDMPGHSTSWLTGYPDLGSAPGPFGLVREWGIFDNLLDPSRDEVYAFLDRFLGEMAGLFPDAYLHIGGDEVRPRQWNGTPRILDYMYRNDLRAAPDLQAHFNLRLSRILAAHGKSMVGWDEILREDLPKDIVVQSWRGSSGLAASARLGVSGILSHGYYLDLMFSAADHYAADPIPPDSPLSAAERERILGGEACMWGEFVSPETIDSRIWPRLLAVAERLWSPTELRDVGDVYRRMEIESARLDSLGLRHNSGYEPMLARLAGPAGSAGVAPLRVLVDVVQPVKRYRRGQLRAFTQATPLDRIADAARPESLPARRFSLDVDRFVLHPEDVSTQRAVAERLEAWRDNHAVLDPILAAAPLAADGRSLSRDLSALGRLGLAAQEAARAGRPPSSDWVRDAEKLLRGAGEARAEVEIAVVPAVRKLVLAAEQIETRSSLGAAAWAAALDEQVKRATAAQP